MALKSNFQRRDYAVKFSGQVVGIRALVRKIRLKKAANMEVHQIG